MLDELLFATSTDGTRYSGTPHLALAEGGADLAEDGADLAEEGLAEPGLADRWSSAKQRLSQILRLSLIHCMQCLSDICGQTSSGPNWDPQL